MNQIRSFNAARRGSDRPARVSGSAYVRPARSRCRVAFLAATLGLCAAFGAATPGRSAGLSKPPTTGPTVQYSYVNLYVDSAAYTNSSNVGIPAAALSGATVTVNGASVPTSGSSSEFTLSMSPNTSESVTITCSGYQTQTITVTSAAASTTVTKTIYMNLSAPPTYPYAGVTGTVSDTVDAVSPATSTPVANATVTLTVNGGTPFATTTDSSGNYSIAVAGGIPTGATLAVTTSAYGYVIGTSTTTESGTSATAGAGYSLGATTLTPNNAAVFSNGSMSYIYGCNYPSWEYADFAPNYLAYWYAGCPNYNYDSGNVETDSASPYNGQLVSVQTAFTNMGALTPVSGNTPMRTVRWFLFSQMAYALLWNGESASSNSDFSANAKVSTKGANQNTIDPATGAKNPLLTGITQSGLDYTTYTEIGLALTYAAQNNIKILFTLGTFYDLEGNSGNHRAVGSTTEVANGKSLGTTVQDSFFNNAVIPALQYITAWQKANGKNVVFAYDILNEPDQDTYGVINGNTMTGTYINGDTGNDPNALLSIADVQSFIKRGATAVHTYGGGALATADTSQPQVLGLIQGCGLDFYCAHYYGYWNDATNGDYPPDSWSLGSGLPAFNTIGNGGGAPDKPCVIEEMQTAEQTSDTDGSGNHLTANWILNRVLSQGYAGALGWGYSLSYADNNEYSDSLGTSSDPLSHWSYFEPFFTAWPGNNSYNPATGTGVVIGPN